MTIPSLKDPPAAAAAPPPAAVSSQSQSLFPDAKVEPELGVSDEQSVVAILEMTQMTPITDLKAEPTIAIINQPHENPIPLELEEKLGDKCCGCCCDYRRAVILVDAVIIGLNVFSIMTPNFTQEYLRSYYDDDFVDDLVPILEDYEMKRNILAAVTVFTAFVSQTGAIIFSMYMVGLHAAWMVLEYILFMFYDIQLSKDLEEPLEAIDERDVSYFWPGVIVQGFFLALLVYPHLGFISEVKAGIMTLETYPREDYSCCCTRGRPAPQSAVRIG